MVDLSSEMAVLARRLGPPPGAAARAVLFVAPKAGAGVTTVALEFARHVAATARKGVWLIELDLMKGEIHDRMVEARDLVGRLGEPVRASPADAMFFTVTPKTRDAGGRPWPDVRYLAAHSVGPSKLWITRFRRESLRPGQTAQILSEPDYWESLKPHADYVIVDAPAADRSQAALAVAPFMDVNVLVVSAEARDDAALRSLRDDLHAAGGRCAGLVLTRAPEAPPSFLRKILP
jgi:Mrp family chromosome partitioning ATPase